MITAPKYGSLRSYSSESRFEVNGKFVQPDELNLLPNTSPNESPSSSKLDLLLNLPKDAKLLLLCKSVRMFSFGILAVILVVYLIELDMSITNIGFLFTLTLLGDAVISIILTSHADKWGRRWTLLVGSILSVVTGLLFATQTNYWILLACAIVGVISPSGKEVGPFVAVELSSLSQVARVQDRTLILAWYNMFGDFSAAFGGLFCGWFVSFLTSSVVNMSFLAAYKSIMFVYSVIHVMLVILFYSLSKDIEINSLIRASLSSSPEIAEEVKVNKVNPVSLFMGLHKSKRIVLQLSLLFMIDAFAGSFILQSLISNWFYTKFHTKHEVLGAVVFICNMVAGISALFAVRIAESIGLVLTMVVTHLPSNIMLLFVPVMPNETCAIALLALRFSISQMDVPTRNAYVQGVVDSDERSAANGVTNVVRSIGASSGPLLAGMLYSKATTRDIPWLIAGGLKIVYDLALLYCFQSLKPEGEV